jgi:uncharacterized tellurite resistance protein B-like protein
MHEQDFSILKALVPVAWADGEFKEREKQTIDALLDAFGATDAEREAIRVFAETPKKLEDIDLAALSAGDRRQLLQHAVLLSFSDGDQSKEEQEFLTRLVDYLHVPKDEAATLMSGAAERAKKHLDLL